MKIALGVIAILLAIALIVWGVREILHARRRQEFITSPWEAVIESHDKEAEVLIVRPGHDPVHVGSVSILEEHWAFEEKLTELWLEAESKAHAMNRSRD